MRRGERGEGSEDSEEATVVVEESRQCEGVAAALSRFEASVPYGAGKPWKGGVADRGAALRAKVAREAAEVVPPSQRSTRVLQLLMLTSGDD